MDKQRLPFCQEKSLLCTCKNKLILDYNFLSQYFIIPQVKLATNNIFKKLGLLPQQVHEDLYSLVQEHPWLHTIHKRPAIR